MHSPHLHPRRASAPVDIPLRSVARGLTPKSASEVLQLALGALATDQRLLDRIARLGAESSQFVEVVEATTMSVGWAEFS